MKITLSGTPGSGKSTIRKMIAEHYGLEVKATGDFMREAAFKHGYTDITRFLVEYVSKHPEIDHQVDQEQRSYGEQHGHFVLDAHLGFHFVPDSFKICLTCDPEEAGRRIYSAKRDSEEAATLEDAIRAVRKRRQTMRDNFMRLYQVDIDDFSQFDFFLNTTRLSIQQVFVELVNEIDRRFETGPAKQ